MKKAFSVVVKTVIIRDGKALCLLRSDSEVRNSRLNPVDFCDLPGGGLQYYEKIEDGILRETMEETGLTVNLLKPINTYDIIKGSLHVIFVTYLSEYAGGEVCLSHEHKGYNWLTRSDVEDSDIQNWLKRIFYLAFEEYEALALRQKIQQEGM